MNITCPTGSIKSVNKAKYLGMYLDYKLNFLDHIKVVETKVARSVTTLYKLKYVLPKRCSIATLPFFRAFLLHL